MRSDNIPLHKPIARTKRNYNCDTEQLVFNSTLTVNRSTWLAELSWDSLCQPPTLCCLSSPPPPRLCCTNKRVQLALLIALIHTPFGQQRRPEVASNGNRNNNNKRKSRRGRGWARGLEIPRLGAAETEALVARICCSVQCTIAKRSAFSMHCTPTQPRPAHQPPSPHLLPVCVHSNYPPLKFHCQRYRLQLRLEWVELKPWIRIRLDSSPPASSGTRFVVRFRRNCYANFWRRRCRLLAKLNENQINRSNPNT